MVIPHDGESHLMIDVYPFILDPESPVIFGRSFLLMESANTVLVCNTEVKR